jgi:large subunit ribosomal protein L3
MTVLECPPIKILSIRFYKNSKVALEVLADNLDKELKKVVKLPKENSKKLSEIKVSDYDDVHALVYSQVKKTNIKKTPDIIELDVAGNSIEEKFKLIQDKLGKEISILEVFDKNQLVDVRGLTKGKGLCGPVKRFGITLKSHKSEKGVRRPGSLGPWHPARVTYRAPQAGQLGLFTRVTYNNKIIDMGKADEKFKAIKNFGDVKSDYVLVRGSVQGPAKRQLLLTTALRPTRKQLKNNFELLEIR